ncbi:MAG: hypothetical protein HYR90_03540 [Candidatus Andersenbacteria bacterium]|nr:hypothetical protein [Candidatus Andersenbacteria bacterium]MBI3250339.1 hypothetical protein [Candidatus Andersenbacteria bacterium]
MRYQEAFIKTSKGGKEFDSVNATLLQKGSFIHQTMAGVYTFLPLGWRVLTKIENIVREEMNAIGSELLMPTLSPRKLWETTNRTGIDVLLQAVGANDASLKKNPGGYIVNPTHEEVITPIARQTKPSYRDLPFAVYQIQTKFRNEERPKSGLLRGREFRMKDLYSFHASKEDLDSYYEKSKSVYQAIFEHIGLGNDTVIALASGGDFTKDFSHEFQTKCEAGEDLIYHDEAQGVYYNKEVAPAELQKKIEPFAACEVGNIFPLGTKFTEAFDYTYTDESGQKQPVFMACYGIGTSRVMGVIVEKFHDDRGITWPDAVAPFTVHLVSLPKGNPAISKQAEEIYQALMGAGIDVLFDDRPDAAPGEKFADADLLGCPWRVVVSEKTGENIELKRRSEKEFEIITLDKAVNRIHGA